jgi:uncharacterized protein (TIGR03435 family)
MLRFLRLTPLGLLLFQGVRCAAQPEEPKFEAASVKPARNDRNPIDARFTPGRLTVTNYRLRDLIHEAYELMDYQITGGPAWVGADRFDIVATTETPVEKPVMLRMLRQLLAERFHLKAMLETREMPVYALTMERKKPGLRRVPAEDASKPDWGYLRGGVRGHKMTIQWLADALAIHLRRPVLDQTGLEGTYDFEIHWEDGIDAANDTGGPSIFTAVRETLGLKLEAKRGPGTILVIEHADKPTND